MNHRPACVPGEPRDLTAQLESAVLEASRSETASSRRGAGTLCFPDPCPPDSHPLVGFLGQGWPPSNAGPLPADPPPVIDSTTTSTSSNSSDVLCSQGTPYSERKSSIVLVRVKERSQKELGYKFDLFARESFERWTPKHVECERQ